MFAVGARRASEMPPELAREVTLVGESGAQRDVRKRGIAVDEGAAGDAEAPLAQETLRGEMERRLEPAREGPHRHVRERRQLLVADLVLEVRAHVAQHGPEARRRRLDAAARNGPARTA